MASHSHHPSHPPLRTCEGWLWKLKKSGATDGGGAAMPAASAGGQLLLPLGGNGSSGAPHALTAAGSSGGSGGGSSSSSSSSLKTGTSANNSTHVGSSSVTPHTAGAAGGGMPGWFRWNKRYFTIENANFCYYHHEPSATSHSEPTFSISLLDIVDVYISPLSSKGVYCFCVSIPFRTFTLKAATKEAAEKWMRSLKVQMHAKSQKAARMQADSLLYCASSCTMESLSQQRLMSSMPPSVTSAAAHPPRPPTTTAVVGAAVYGGNAMIDSASAYAPRAPTGTTGGASYVTPRSLTPVTPTPAGTGLLSSVTAPASTPLLSPVSVPASVPVLPCADMVSSSNGSDSATDTTASRGEPTTIAPSATVLPSQAAIISSSQLRSFAGANASAVTPADAEQCFPRALALHDTLAPPLMTATPTAHAAAAPTAVATWLAPSLATRSVLHDGAVAGNGPERVEARYESGSFLSGSSGSISSFTPGTGGSSRRLGLTGLSTTVESTPIDACHHAGAPTSVWAVSTRPAPPPRTPGDGDDVVRAAGTTSMTFTRMPSARPVRTTDEEMSIVFSDGGGDGSDAADVRRLQSLVGGPDSGGTGSGTGRDLLRLDNMEALPDADAMTTRRRQWSMERGVGDAVESSPPAESASHLTASRRTPSLAQGVSGGGPRAGSFADVAAYLHDAFGTPESPSSSFALPGSVTDSEERQR